MWREVDEAAGGHRASLGPHGYHFVYHPADSQQRAPPDEPAHPSPSGVHRFGVGMAQMRVHVVPVSSDTAAI
eukprot:1474247-Alexandrium_andersonii.AAC.1